MSRERITAATTAMVRAGMVAGLNLEIARHIAGNFVCGLVDPSSPDGVSLVHVTREDLVTSLRYQRDHWPDTVPSSDLELDELAAAMWNALEEAVR